MTDPLLQLNQLILHLDAVPRRPYFYDQGSQVRISQGTGKIIVARTYAINDQDFGGTHLDAVVQDDDPVRSLLPGTGEFVISHLVHPVLQSGVRRSLFIVAVNTVCYQGGLAGGTETNTRFQ